MPWISEPYVELPPPIQLPITVADQSVSGVIDGNWIKWPNHNPQLPTNHFLHRDWKSSGDGFEGTNQMMYVLQKYMDKRIKTNVRMTLKKKNVEFEHIIYPDIMNRFPRKRHSAHYRYYGGTVCLIWQDPVKGWWNLTNLYGTVQGIEVKLHRSVEWQLRSRTMIGYLYWYGKDRHSSNVNKRRMLRGKTGWNWDDVDIELWGYDVPKFVKTVKGIKLMDTRYISLKPFAGKMMVGSHSVIPNDLLGDSSNKWHEWLIQKFKEGRSIGWQAKRGYRGEAGKYDWYDVPLEEMLDKMNTAITLGKI
jgi:hypothetical protein